MKQMIEYFRHEPQLADEKRKANLQIFFYDIPGLTTCGIFPPLQVLNEVLMKGRLDDDNGRGASWTPFLLGEEEYQKVLPKILDPKLEFLTNRARFNRQAWSVAPEFDHLHDRASWKSAIIEKYSGHNNSTKMRSDFTLIVSLGDSGQAHWKDLAALPLRVIEHDEPAFASPSQVIQVPKTTIAVEQSQTIEIAALLDLDNDSYSIQVMQENQTLLLANGKYAALAELYGPDLILMLPEGNHISLKIVGPGN